MRLLKYSDFILEEAGRVTGLFKLSREIRYNLERLIRDFKDPVANALLELDRSQQEITCVNLSNDSNMVSYIDMSRIKRFHDEFVKVKNLPTPLKKYSLEDFIRIYNIKPNVGELSATYFGIKVSFTEISIGRFIKKLFYDTFTDVQVSQFVERWVSVNTSGEFEIWRTEKILDAYNSGNYEEYMGSSLDHSCMNDDSSVNFYKVCPGVKILVLLDGDNSIKGRCLLWEDIDGKKIMDKVYYNTESDYYKFVKWGTDNDYYIRNGKAGKLYEFTYKGKPVTLKTKVKFPNIEEYRSEYFPFVDTFCYAKDGFGMNYEPTESGDYYKLQETDGTYEILYNIDPKQRDMTHDDNW
jgi:hypothetical protein